MSPGQPPGYVAPGQGPGPWERRRRWPWIAGAVVVALGLIGIYDRGDYDLGRLAGTTRKTTTPTPSASTAQTPSASTMETPTTAPAGQPVAEPTRPGVLALGDSAIVTGDITGAGVITVKSLKITTRPYDASAGYPPEQGYFLIFTVSVGGDAEFDVFEDDFYVNTSKGKRLQEGNGNSWDAVDLDNLLDAVLSTSERQTGFVVFDSPVKHGILAYVSNLEGGPIVSWKF